MTIPGSGIISIHDANTEFGLGEDFGHYRGVQWWTENGATGNFSSGTISMYEFYNKRSTAPFVNVDYLIVAGGGNGGAAGPAGNAGGGGGGGGVLLGSATLSGALGASYAVGVGSVNQNSSFNGLTAIAGGNGAAGQSGLNGGDGGSGGGGGRADFSHSGGYGGSGTPGQGYNGGAGSLGTYSGVGGGGGGAGGLGGDAYVTGAGYLTGGPGGNGLYSDISGAGAYYGSGGGGGGSGLIGGTAGDGLGSGNYGSGGSGNGPNAGVQGVVIIRYAGSQKFNGGSISSSGGYTIHTFTSSGSFTKL